MGEYSKIELAILEKFTEAIDTFIEIKTYSQNDKDKMQFVSCVTEDDKKDYTIAEIKKMRKKLAKCNPDIAGCLSCYINPSKLDLGGDSIYDYRTRLIRNFLLGEINDVLEVLKPKFKTLKSIEEIYMEFWEEIILYGDYGINHKDIKHFVKHMAIADRLYTFKRFLEIEEVSVVKESENETHSMLVDLQAKESSYIELYQLVKEKTDLDSTALQYFKKDIEMYIFYEKDELGCKYSREDVDKAIRKLRDERGYDKQKLIDAGIYYKSLIGDEEEKDSYSIDREKLLFPFEFDNLEQLLGVVNAELTKQGVVERKNYLINSNKKIDVLLEKRSKKEYTFETIFSDDKKKQYVLGMLEDLSITNNGKSILSPRKKSVIRGLVEALREACVLPNKDLHSLCLIIGTQIGLEIKSKLEKNYTAEESYKTVIQYMKSNPLH